MKYLIFLAMLFVYASQAEDIEFKRAVPSDFGKTQRTSEEKLASPIISQVVKSQGLGGSLSLAYTNMSSGSVWFRLYDNFSVYAVDISKKEFIGSWSLRSPLSCEGEDAGCKKQWWSGRWSESEYIEPKILERINDYDMDEEFDIPYAMESSKSFGCFIANPMRYGDVDGDGKSELAVLTPQDFILFSTGLKKTIFAFMFNNNDWVTWQSLIDGGLLLESNPDSPQYGSLKVAEYGSGVIGYRAYGKIYIGHFSGGTTNDILVWRKFYQSRLIKDPIKGFEKVSDTFIHYKLINGEYQKQATPEETIKGWLAAKQLTWQKGYPSKSECPGQEGQLIPEMHDPLLNDPDVLQ